jgi:hypothetical protein
VEFSEGFHQQLRVKALGIRRGTVVLGFEVEDVLPGPAMKSWKGINGNGTSNGVTTGRPNNKSEINRWNDDGGNSMSRLSNQAAVEGSVAGRNHGQ